MAEHPPPSDRKRYVLLAADGTFYESETPGTLAGNRRHKLYGALHCQVARKNLLNYSQDRVFFADRAIAIAAGYHPCAACCREEYILWRRGGEPGTLAYPWRVLPKKLRQEQ